MDVGAVHETVCLTETPTSVWAQLLHDLQVVTARASAKEAHNAGWEILVVYHKQIVIMRILWMGLHEIARP